MAGKRKSLGAVADINVTPMVDIMLVLLIIFMVITPMLQKGVSVDMARAANPRAMQDADKDDAVLVAVTRDGKVFLGTTPISLDELTKKVADMISGRLDKTVYVKSDARAKYGDVDPAVAPLRLVDGPLAVLTVSRHDPLGYDIRTELFGSKDSVSVGLGPRTPLRSVEPGVAPPAGPAWPDFLSRFPAAYAAEFAAYCTSNG